MRGIIFDLDGVITRTSVVHNKAWKSVFDNFLRFRSNQTLEPFIEYSSNEDYLKYVDGRPRYDGVRIFLESRGIFLPEGTPSDSPDLDTVCGIGNRKDMLFNELLESDGVEVFESTVDLIKVLKTKGIPIGVASSSRNCRKILKATRLDSLFDTIVDGGVSSSKGLKGKPEPDIFLFAADCIGVDYDRCVIVEDAASGVAAGRKGNFGLVIGIARENNREHLLENGADIVVDDISELGYEGITQWFREGYFEDSWSLCYYGYDRLQERKRETLLSTGNGFFCTRGSMEDAASGQNNYHGTYMSGVYNKLASVISGRTIFNEDLVNITDWHRITFRSGTDEWFDINKAEIISIKRSLSLYDGVLKKVLKVRDNRGRETLIESSRVVSMHCRNLAAIEYKITPLNWDGVIFFRSEISGDHINDGVSRYRELNQKHLTPVDEWIFGNLQHVEVKTTESGIGIKHTARLNVKTEGKNFEAKFSGFCTPGVSVIEIETEAEQRKQIVIEKTVFIDLKKDNTYYYEDPVYVLHLSGGFSEIRDHSAQAWKAIWEKVDIRIAGDRLSQKLLRMHIYHLMCTASPNSVKEELGIPARGLTGEAYRGHIFWDELYILPFYCMHFPDIARSVLLYRYQRLGAARQNAVRHGFKGAMYPWQSGTTGEEETQQIHFNPLSGKWDEDYSSLQRHVSLAISWNVLKYYEFTGDMEFMEKFGLEMLLEICRFWCSMTIFNRDTCRYSINNVMGPDEFHEKYPWSESGGINDNAYTNIMVAWLFRKTKNLISAINYDITEGIFERTGIDRNELSEWNRISGNLNLVITDEGIISQFDRFFDLKEINLEHYRKVYDDIHRMDRILKAEGKSPDEYQVIKQADTLMLFYNIDHKELRSIIAEMGYEIPEDYIKRNFDYYLKRTSHGSTLSRIVHAYLAHLIGEDVMAWKLFQDALKSDYDDIQGGSVAEGIHCGVMAATVLFALNVYGGFDNKENRINVNSTLPAQWREIEFGFEFRGKLNHNIKT